MVDHIAIERSGRRWAVKHNGGFLGFAPTREEAARIAQDLQDWATERGRAPAVVPGAELRSFAPSVQSVGRPSAAWAAATARASTSEL